MTSHLTVALRHKDRDTAQQLNHMAMGTLGSAKLVGIISLVLLFMKHHTVAAVCLCGYAVLIIITIMLSLKAMKIHSKEPYEKNIF
jgi:hypothetical protein